jgi:hypothetical protein
MTLDETRKIAMITTGSSTIADALEIVLLFARELDTDGLALRKKYIKERF